MKTDERNEDASKKLGLAKDFDLKGVIETYYNDRKIVYFQEIPELKEEKTEYKPNYWAKEGMI